eukprot:jgi/Undpi1/11623/HiC_scaffold_30.g13918.m1
MWIGLREAAAENERPITGIMNPNSGPITDQGSLGVYLDTLKNVMGIGEGATYMLTQKKPTIICYISTAYGNQETRPKAEVIGDISAYDTFFPGVCDGIFFDEAEETGLTDGNGDLTSVGQLYFDYNEAALDANKTVTFNPGVMAEAVYHTWEGPPTLMSFENEYARIKNAGMPRAPESGSPDSPAKNAIFVHSASELEDDVRALSTDPALVKAMVEKAACSGWEQLYFTGSLGSINPYGEAPTFWSSLVDEVSQDINIVCPNSAESRMRIMVPLLSNPVPADLTTALTGLMKSDYGDVVSVVVDASDATTNTIAAALRDAGARILCYLDATGVVADPGSGFFDTSGYANNVCGGFYIDNLDTAVVSQSNINNIYANSQFAVPGGTTVFKPADASAAENEYLYTNDWDQVSIQLGRVVVATVVDGATATTVPSHVGSTQNSAVMMTGFSGDIPCVIADMAAASYGYAYVTEAEDFATLSSYWDTLVTETAPLAVTPTSPTVLPCAAPAVTACGAEETVATMSWNPTSRRLRINGGCADMTRIASYFGDQPEPITGVLSQVVTDGVPTGIWELDGTLDVRSGATLKIIGEGFGECDELRLVSNSLRSRILGIGGDIVIHETEVYGWKNGELDPVETDRGYIYCASCTSGASDECIMSVTNSIINNLGSGGVTTGGLSWRNFCDSDTPALATAQNVTIKDNRRGIYARGVDLDFEELTVSGGTHNTIQVDACSGTIKDCEVSPVDSRWGILGARSPGITIADNTLSGERGLLVTSANSDTSTDDVTITGNNFEPSIRAVRVSNHSWWWVEGFPRQRRRRRDGGGSGGAMARPRVDIGPERGGSVAPLAEGGETTGGLEAEPRRAPVFTATSALTRPTSGPAVESRAENADRSYIFP